MSSISIEDNILLLLTSQAQHPIWGVEMLIGQLLMSREKLLPQSEPITLQVHGKCKRMFSRSVEKAIENLRWNGLVIARGRINTNLYHLRITEKGQSYITNLFNSLPSETRERLCDFRIGWDQLGTDGMKNLLDAYHLVALKSA
jgi:hypothetical protein